MTHWQERLHESVNTVGELVKRFGLSVAKGLEIIAAIQGWTSGPAVPHFVIDAPGGGGKIPLLPDYVQAITDRETVLRNYAGKTYRYILSEPDAPPTEE